jgi:hypothetical protein
LKGIYNNSYFIQFIELEKKQRKKMKTKIESRSYPDHIQIWTEIAGNTANPVILPYYAFASLHPQTGHRRAMHRTFFIHFAIL